MEYIINPRDALSKASYSGYDIIFRSPSVLPTRSEMVKIKEEDQNKLLLTKR